MLKILSSLSNDSSKTLAKSGTSLSSVKVNNVSIAKTAEVADKAYHLELDPAYSGSVTNSSPTSWVSLPMNKMHNHLTYLWLLCKFSSSGSSYSHIYLLGTFYFDDLISSTTKTSIVSYTFDTNSNYNVAFATNNNQMLSLKLGHGIAQNLSSYTVFYRIF